MEPCAAAYGWTEPEMLALRLDRLEWWAECARERLRQPLPVVIMGGL